MPLIKHRPGAIAFICILIALALIGLTLRVVWFKPGGVFSGDKVWQLTLDSQFRADRAGSAIHIALPVDTRNARVLAQNFYYPELRQSRLKDKKGDIREAVFIAPQKGHYFLQAEFRIQFSASPHWIGELRKPALTPENRDVYLSSAPHIQSDKDQVQKVFQQLFSHETDKNRLLDLIADFCEKKIAAGSSETSDNAESVLTTHKATTIGRARAMIALCRIGKIPARLISGFVLKENPEARPYHWIEVFMDNDWLSFDPENGYRYKLPLHFLPLRRGGSDISRIKDGVMLLQNYHLTHIATPRGLASGEKKNLIEVFDLTRLPITTQTALIMLLMLPVGALITTFVRNVLGVMTFGVFSPTLLALALVYTDWRTAAIIFVIVVIIGLGGRSLLPGLKLMQVPRLSVVFTVVALTMSLTVSFLDFIHFSPSGLVVLLPLVVLTNMIDRAYKVADESGIRNAALRFGWTVVVAFVCVFIFRWQLLGQLLLAYPELHLMTLALIIALGLFGERRLADIPVFHFLNEDRKKGQKQPPGPGLHPGE